MGRMGGAFVHVIGAETLKGGKPVDLGWIPLFLLALAVAVFVTRQRELPRQLLIIGCSAVVVLFGPTVAEAQQVYLDVTPACFVLITIGIVLARRGFRQRGLVNAVSGLSNLTALRANRSGRDQTLIAARVMNYAEIAATLPQESERQLVDQIVARLKVGAPDRTLYQGDGGIFAWFEDSRQAISNHVEALHSLFRNPARVGGLSVDLTVAFGVEIGSSRSLSNRLASAVVAAEEAAHDGLKWKYHDPETLQDASWKLSMLSQLDSAVDKGEVWVAYQPKLDLASRTIIGAEALARWTHPEKGPIAASEFVAAAEQHDRIGKLSDFVLEQAIAAAASLSVKQPGFGMAVNLSARLLDDRGFILRLSAMLARHKLPPHQLTLELTETAALAGSGTAVEILVVAEGSGRDDFHRRLWHGPLDPRLSEEDPGQRDQDRPKLRQGHGRQPQRPRDGAIDHRPGALAWPEGRRRRSRAARNPRCANRDEMRRRPRLHHRPANESRSNRQANSGIAQAKVGLMVN